MLEGFYPYVIIAATVVIFFIRTIEYSIIVDDIQFYGKFRKGHYYFKKDIFKSENFLGKMRYLIGFVRNRLYGGCTFGSNTIYDHALATFLHVVTCCLIYPALGGDVISFMAALLYAVNPINNQTAIWINGRRYQVVIILCLLALLLKPFGFVFYLSSFMFQMTGFFLPILYLDISPWFLLAMPVLAILALPQIQASYLSRMGRILNRDQKTWGWNRIKVVVKSYGFYFFKMIHPGVVMMNYTTLIQWGVTKRGNYDAYALNGDFLKGIFAFVLTGGIIAVPELRLIGLFMFFGILQWSAIICAYQQLADRYVSLVAVFMMYIVSWLAYQMPYGLVICSGLFAYYATQLNVAMQMYKTIDLFFEYQMFWHPEMARNRVIYADSFMAVKDVTRAWLIVEMGLRYDPDDFELLLRAAQCSASIGMLDKAEHFLGRAEKNFYIGQEEIQKRRISTLREQMGVIAQKIDEANRPESRQVRRAKQRKEHGNEDRIT